MSGQVAQDFIWANDLPQDHLDEIARFIDRNANQGVTLGSEPVPTRGADPFTGAHNAMYEAAGAAQNAGAPISHIPKRAMVMFLSLFRLVFARLCFCSAFFPWSDNRTESPSLYLS